MSIDGFRLEHKEAFAAYAPRVADEVCATINHVGRALGVRVDGIERLPPGRALLVANHAFGFDVAFPMAAIHRATGRRVWALGEHAWWRVPVVRRLAAAVGTVDGTLENAARLLDHDEIVVVMPGGLREAMKPRELRYRLLWGHRYGFLRAAARSRAPIVPLACVGGDEVFELVGDAFARGARWLGTRAIPIPRPAHGFPIVHRVPLRFILGAPIPPPVSEDDVTLARVRREVEGALHELLDRELAARAGFEA
jgi:1-acyl-sn-glycerol-3-phosphate acyltransferase